MSFSAFYTLLMRSGAVSQALKYERARKRPNMMRLLKLTNLQLLISRRLAGFGNQAACAMAAARASR